MRNRFLQISLTLVAAVVFLMSCSKKQSDYVNVIPGDAQVVTGINVYSLLDKSGALDNKTLQEQLKQEIASGLNSGQQELFGKIVADPEEAGIDLKSNMYMWLDDVNMGTGGFVMAVKDKEKLMNVLNSVLDGENLFTESDGYMRASDKDFAVAFNERMLVACTSKSASQKDTKAIVDECLKRTADQSIVSQKEFKKKMDASNDMLFYVSMDMLYANSNMQLPSGFPINKSKVVGTLNVEKDRVSCDVNTVIDDSMKDMYKQWMSNVDKVSGKFMKYFKDNALGVFFFNVNGAEVYKSIKQYPELENMYKDAFKGVDMEKLFSALDGEIAMGVNAMSVIPEVLVCAEVENEDIVNMLNEEFNGRKVADGKYVANVAMVTLYYGMDGKTFYMSVSSDNSEGPKTQKPDFTDCKYSSNVKGSYGYFGLNVRQMMMLPYAGMLKGNMGEGMFNLLNNMEYFEVYSEDYTNAKMVLYTGGKDNILKQLVDCALEMNK